MNADTLRALEESIAHWTRLSTGTQTQGETIFTAHCALCQLFNAEAAENPCSGCPVMQRTGEPQCLSTPWKDVYFARKDFGQDSLEFRLAAKEMLSFLESLLPPNDKSE